MRLISVFVLLCAIAACSSNSVQPASTVFFNGAVYTVDAAQPWASAVATRGTDIVYVGDKAGAIALTGPDTVVIDLHGQMLLPGFHDTHAHPIGGGLNLTILCNLSGLLELDLIKIKLGACAQSLPEGAWLQGAGWSTGSFPNGNPTRQMLDDIPGNHPIYLTDEGGHSAWVNSQALLEAGITAETPATGPAGFHVLEPGPGSAVVGHQVRLGNLHGSALSPGPRPGPPAPVT